MTKKRNAAKHFSRPKILLIVTRKILKRNFNVK